MFQKVQTGIMVKYLSLGFILCNLQRLFEPNLPFFFHSFKKSLFNTYCVPGFTFSKVHFTHYSGLS